MKHSTNCEWAKGEDCECICDGDLHGASPLKDIPTKSFSLFSKEKRTEPIVAKEYVKELIPLSIEELPAKFYQNQNKNVININLDSTFNVALYWLMLSFILLSTAFMWIMEICFFISHICYNLIKAIGQIGGYMLSQVWG